MIPVLAILAALCGGLGYYCRWWVRRQRGTTVTRSVSVLAPRTTSRDDAPLEIVEKSD